MSPYRLMIASSSPGTWAIVAAALAGAAAGFHGVAFVLLLLVMMLDLLTGTRRARRNPDEVYDTETAFAGLESKGRRLILVLVAFSVDAMLIALARHTGTGLELALRCPISGAAIAAQYVTEGYSVLDNVRRTEGRDVGLISKILAGALQHLTSDDSRKHAARYGVPAPGRREYDRQPDAVAEVIAEEIAPAVTTTPLDPPPGNPS